MLTLKKSRLNTYWIRFLNTASGRPQSLPPNYPVAHGSIWANHAGGALYVTVFMGHKGQNIHGGYFSGMDSRTFYKTYLKYCKDYLY